MHFVIDQLQKYRGLHLDSAAEQRSAEQPCGFEQVNVSDDFLNVKSIDPKLCRACLQGPVMVNMFAAGDDSESIREIDDQIIAVHLDVVRPAAMETDGIVGVDFNVIPHIYVSLICAEFPAEPDSRAPKRYSDRA